MGTDQRNWWLCVVPKYPIRSTSGAYEATRSAGCPAGDIGRLSGAGGIGFGVLPGGGLDTGPHQQSLGKDHVGNPDADTNSGSVSRRQFSDHALWSQAQAHCRNEVGNAEISPDGRTLSGSERAADRVITAEKCAKEC